MVYRACHPIPSHGISRFLPSSTAPREDEVRFDRPHRRIARSLGRRGAVWQADPSKPMLFHHEFQQANHLRPYRDQGLRHPYNYPMFLPSYCLLVHLAPVTFNLVNNDSIPDAQLSLRPAATISHTPARRPGPLPTMLGPSRQSFLPAKDCQTSVVFRWLPGSHSAGPPSTGVGLSRSVTERKHCCTTHVTQLIDSGTALTRVGLEARHFVGRVRRNGGGKGHFFPFGA
ncbi:hypothetical protein LZ30DRAFT_343767 [Colletotrichum cereale]|nr:hypothetical protein LZ30DRAFT_343767 [Colletotrichum cereale]